MNEKLSITLPAEMVNVIKAKVEAGDYASTSEVLRAAMRTWMREEEEYQERIASIRAQAKDPRAKLTPEEMDKYVKALLRGQEL